MVESDSYLKVLNPEQKQAVIHSGSPLLILAGAGSGKTRVITTKIAWLIDQGVDPRSILAVTFTKKAANEMKERACRLTPQAQFAQIRTFHSFGSWFLRLYGEYCGLSSSFSVYDDDDVISLLSKVEPELNRVDRATAAHGIARAKDYCLTPESSDFSVVSNDVNFPEIYAKYEKRLRETGNVDFGDLILLPLLLLQKEEVIRSQIQKRFSVIMVDEYQDSNVAQFELLKMLVGPQTYVCVVGDDDQSIYSFRGAEVKNILTFQDSFLGSELIKLESNYRSVSPILTTADQVVSKNKERLGKVLHSVRGEGKKPSLVFLANQDEETAFCAKMIEQAHEKGCPYSDWAVLYRTNAQSLGFETEFLNQKIPYRVVGSLKFYDREEIKDVLAYISLVLNPKDEINFARIVNKPTRAVGAVTQDKIINAARAMYETDPSANLLTACNTLVSSFSAKAKKGLQTFLSIMQALNDEIGDLQESQTGFSTENLAFDALNQGTLTKQEPEKSLSSFIEKLSKITGLSEYHEAQDEIAGTQRVANIQELANSACLYPKTKEGLTLFLEHIELDRTISGQEEETDAVTLITLHNTKGLEFPRVIITGIEKGIFPREDKKNESLEEERRLFYVGITRAKDELYLTTCGMRRMYGRMNYTEPSPFLYEINLDSVNLFGNVPSYFKRRAASIGNSETSKQNDPLLEHWKIGTKLFHDDFGYGVISKNEFLDNDFVITVNFETGMSKRFMPAFQANKLMIIKE